VSCNDAVLILEVHLVCHSKAGFSCKMRADTRAIFPCRFVFPAFPCARLAHIVK
jgi:hypothetical protein